MGVLTSSLNLAPAAETAEIKDLPLAVVLLQQILAELQIQIDPGKLTFSVDYITVGLTPIALYAYQKPVRSAIIQNLSTTDTITLVHGPKGRPGTMTTGQGILLNPAPAAGQGGGSQPFLNCDLSEVTLATNNNNSQYVAVFYFI